MTDLHLHSSISFDSDEAAGNYLKAAAARGDTALGFSEHYDYDVALDGGGHPLPDLSAYSSQICRLSAEYPAIKVLKGVELGYAVEAEPHYRALVAEGGFDYVIMSLHTLKGRGDCYFPEFYRGLTRDQAYGAYLRALLNSVLSDVSFQIVGHIGYVARYAPYPDKRLEYSDFPGLFDEILRTIIARGLSLEINTKGKGGEFATDLSVLERYIALGGNNFTFGSDAHSVERYKDGADRVCAFLKTHGIDYICRYEKGERVKEKI